MIDDLIIAPARRQADFDEVSVLTEAFIAWAHERYGDVEGFVDAFYPPQVLAVIYAGLAGAQTPKGGEILLARLGETGAGCLTMTAVEPGVTELKRMFISPVARRRGLAQRMVEDMCAIACDMGIVEVRLEAGARHHEAIPMYERLGFRACPPYSAEMELLPPHLAALVVPLARRLDTKL